MADLRRGEGESDPPGRADRRRSAVLRLGALVVLLGAGFLLVRWTPVGDYLSREGIGRGIDLLRGSAWAPVVFVAVYAVATALAIPGTVLTLAGGALFGVLWGTVFNSIGANLGANAAFFLARGLGREGIEGLLGGRRERRPSLGRIDRVTREHGFRGLLTLRLIPLVPFNALNFGSGLTAISWKAYAGATALGILPGTIVYTFFADALLQGSREASREALVRVLIAGGLLVFLSFLPTLVKKLDLKLPGLSGSALLLWAAGSVGAQVPDSDPLPAWIGAVPDHGAFTEVLREVVEGSRVDYAALRDRHRPALAEYLDALADTDPDALASAPTPVRLAFWINAYNACMLRQVADHYPIESNPSLLGSLRNAVAGRPDNSVWQIEDVFTRDFCPVAGEERSQDEIEHEVIRPLGDPRIHFAVNCAARSCPPLSDEAYVAERLERQLDRAVRTVVSDPAHFRLDREDGRAVLRLNRVLDWYREDFGGIEGLKRFLAPYLPEAQRAVVLDPRTEVAFLEYDWTLNDVPR